MSAQDRSAVLKPQRVLACVLCQQRKVKCDRKFPCHNCVASRVQCVPAASLPRRQRRRRFPERELLDRLRHYEGLLRENNIKFEPLHKNDTTDEPGIRNADADNDDHLNDGSRSGVEAEWAASPATTTRTEAVYKAKNYWQAMRQRPQDSDDDDSSDSSLDEREILVKKAWDQINPNRDHLLLGTRRTNTDLTALHPEQVQIFRLWQVYLDNVNPLLKITHTPSLQMRIIDAASNVASIKPNLAALMFGIYCMAISSLEDSDCHVMFNSSKDDLLSQYQYGCQQALSNCDFLRTSDRDCLTALCLYLISIKPKTDPYSLSALLSIAVRTAQRMGLHSESSSSKCPVLEAEMRRRLWWTLILFDTRICEMAEYKAAMLTPIWDCRTLLNVNDFDLQPEMKESPRVHGIPTEALFAVVRSEIGEFYRHSAFHLDFISPALNTVAKNLHNGPIPEEGELVALENMLEDKYLKFCNPENPLHFMTIWSARGHIAKARLIEHFSRVSKSRAQQTDAQRDAANSHAVRMLQCDTKLVSSALTKGYLWFVNLYFPFPAFLHLFQDLRRRPTNEHIMECWDIMNSNYDARFVAMGQGEGTFFNLFAKFALKAWEASEAAFNQSGDLPTPRMILEIKRTLSELSQDEQTTAMQDNDSLSGVNVDDILMSMSMPTTFSNQYAFDDLEGSTFDGLRPDIVSDAPVEPSAFGFGPSQLHWNLMNWNLMHGGG